MARRRRSGLARAIRPVIIRTRSAPRRRVRRYFGNVVRFARKAYRRRSAGSASIGSLAVPCIAGAALGYAESNMGEYLDKVTFAGLSPAACIAIELFAAQKLGFLKNRYATEAMRACAVIASYQLGKSGLSGVSGDWNED